MSNLKNILFFNAETSNNQFDILKKKKKKKKKIDIPI